MSQGSGPVKVAIASGTHVSHWYVACGAGTTITVPIGAAVVVPVVVVGTGKTGGLVAFSSPVSVRFVGSSGRGAKIGAGTLHEVPARNPPVTPVSPAPSTSETASSGYSCCHQSCSQEITPDVGTWLCVKLPSIIARRHIPPPRGVAVTDEPDVDPSNHCCSGSLISQSLHPCGVMHWSPRSPATMSTALKEVGTYSLLDLARRVCSCCVHGDLQ
mmetsp:Transcript_119063/g.273028  ORF Transcript_119063/g.273028 Transcript_119063/m.273028 type:complete len:215 (+) Transcript_119063:467-1111(+)